MPSANFLQTHTLVHMLVIPWADLFDGVGYPWTSLPKEKKIVLHYFAGGRLVYVDTYKIDLKSYGHPLIIYSPHSDTFNFSKYKNYGYDDVGMWQKILNEIHQTNCAVLFIVLFPVSICSLFCIKLIFFRVLLFDVNDFLRNQWLS